MVNLNRNNSNWSFEERRKINENWAILEGLANSTASGNNGLKQEVDQLKITVSQNTVRVTQANQISNQAAVQANSASTIASEAEVKSTRAENNSNQAKMIAEGIDGKATNALTTSVSANAKSNEAILIANNSRETVKNVQGQFNQIVAGAGSNNPEVVASRIDAETGEAFVNLSQRLDQQHKGITTQLAQKTQDYLALSKDKVGGASDKDNYAELIALVVEAKEKNTGLYVPNGSYFCSEDLVIDGIKNIIIDGSITMAEGKTLEISGLRSYSPSDIKIRSVAGKLRVTGYLNSKIYIGSANIVEFFADGSDSTKSTIAYNTFDLGAISDIIINSSGTGWINENLFIGGRVTNLTIEGAYSHNNNIFQKTSFEHSNIHIKKGHANHFKDCRFEGGHTVTCDAGTFDNTFSQSWSTNNVAHLLDGGLNITDNGSNNIIAMYTDAYYTSTKVDTLTAYSDHNLENSCPFEDKVRVLRAWQPLIQTEKFPIICDFGAILRSDATIFRIGIKLFDENKNEITTPEAIGISGTTISYDTGLGLFRTNTNYDNIGLVVFKNTNAKFVQLFILSPERNALFGQASLYIKHPKKKRMSISVKRPKTNSITEYFQGTYKAGDIIKNSMPKPGQTSEWICVSDGANGKPWVSNTNFVVGDLVASGERVYICTKSGVSGLAGGATAPNHTTGSASDGTVVWDYYNIKATFVTTPIDIVGNASPNGVVTGIVGTVYTDTVTQKVYRKVNGAGNTGWKEVTLA